MKHSGGCSGTRERKVHILEFWYMSGSSSTFPSFLFLFMSVSSLSIFALSAIVASPASVYHAVKFCLIPLTDVCLFQMPFSVKGQPQYSLQLPCSCHPPHLFSLFFSSFSSICITFELCLNPLTRFSLPLPHYKICHCVPLSVSFCLSFHQPTSPSPPPFPPFCFCILVHFSSLVLSSCWEVFSTLVLLVMSCWFVGVIMVYKKKEKMLIFRLNIVWAGLFLWFIPFFLFF